MKTLKQYSTYLRENQLKVLAEENYRLAVAMNIPLVNLMLKSMGHLSDEQMIELSIKSFGDFLLSLEEGTALQRAKASMELWEADKLPGIRKQDILPSDIILIYACQKKVLYKFLPVFTENAAEATSIMQELEDFYTRVQDDGIQMLFKIQKQTDTALKEREEQLQTIFSNAPDAIIACDLNLTVTEWNKAAEQLYGYKAEDILGKNIEEMIHSEHIPPFTKEKAREQMEKTGSWSGEIIQTTKDQKKFIILSSNSFLKNATGKPVGYLGVNRDVTEMRKIEEELHESEKRYHLLVNEVEDYAIITLDLRGNIITWNKGAEKIKGYKEEEVIGKSFSIFYTREDIEKGIPQQNLEEARKEKKHTYSGWRVRKDKSLFWADVVITQLADDKGNLRGFVKITRDLSERRKAEEEIIKKTEELKRSNEELEQFAYVASHDLQEPLRMVTSYVQLLAKRYKDKLDGDAIDFIDFAVDGANRMRTLIYSILEFSRINKTLTPSNVDLNERLEGIIKDLGFAIHESGAKITIGDLPVVYGDPVLLGQLFFNLLANAIKFRSERPLEISITAKKTNGEYLFAVKDNGIGIRKEYSEKIFAIFQKLHTIDKYPGTGIGLSICKKIVERHGGKIWVESEIDKGSVFYFTISSVFK
ncbi:MAG TPA: PAS domain S-box protein [Bacteroidia bacterium]|nr:PAS domain S-box protein [Bacteroidia bacterium]